MTTETRSRYDLLLALAFTGFFGLVLLIAIQALALLAALGL